MTSSQSFPPTSLPTPAPTQWLIFDRLSDDSEEDVLLRSHQGHTLPLVQLPLPLQEMIQPLIAQLRSCSLTACKTLEYSNQEGASLLLDGRRCPFTPTQLFDWEEADLLGRLDLLLWYIVYHQVHLDSRRPDFKSDLNPVSQKFDVRVAKATRDWKCPDCGELIAGGYWWCLNPPCPSRQRLCCCTGWTPPLILVERRKTKDHEIPSWHQALQHVRHALPAS